MTTLSDLLRYARLAESASAGQQRAIWTIHSSDSWETQFDRDARRSNSCSAECSQQSLRWYCGSVTRNSLLTQAINFAATAATSRPSGGTIALPRGLHIAEFAQRSLRSYFAARETLPLRFAARRDRRLSRTTADHCCWSYVISCLHGAVYMLFQLQRLVAVYKRSK